jgi:peptide/nickel transport system permease protein
VILRRGLKSDPAFWFGVVVLAVALAIGIAGPWLAPYDPNANNLMHRLQSPSAAHWFGTDDLGRDIFSRMLAGARISIAFPFGSVALAIVLGLPAGLLAGYGGSRIGRVLEFVSDVMMSFPPLLLAIAFIAVRGPGLGSAMIVVGIIFAPRLFRIARAATQEVMAETYIEAARAIGSSPGQILLWHVLRNIAGPVIVYVSFAMGTALLIEAILSFIGLGVQPPDVDWGVLVAEGARYITSAPNLAFIPSIVIAIVSIAFVVIADTERRILRSSQ